MPKLFDGADVIFRYTRADALRDGVLVDLTEWASPREMLGGFAIQAAVTAAVWALCQVPEGSIESTRGRAHDVLWLARCAVAARRTHSRCGSAGRTCGCGSTSDR